MTLLQPLRFTPLLLPKVWGGDRLRRFGKSVRAGDRIGESWEIADLASTSPSGGGGGAMMSVVAEGAHAGQTLREVLAELGESFLGETKLLEGGAFPLLVKFLDARENLSVQVHPSPQYARRHPEVHLKSETWVVLEAEPASRIYAGLREGVTTDDLGRAIGDGRVPELLHSFEAEPGMMVDLPSGIVHALGAGVLVAEVQTASDTTFRLFDWGRTDREIHIEQAMECVGDAHALRAGVGHVDHEATMTTDAYSIECLSIDPGTREVTGATDSCEIVMVLSGEGSLERDGQSDRLSRGDTLLVPASWDGLVDAGESELRAIRIRVR
ncbi:MAG: type I phosphomannose isomerase catalytic subunit [Phycisphaerales bacterium JB043]